MEKRKILIAEDDADINRLLYRILTGSGYHVVQAFSGTEAKLLLQLETPDLMILDLMMPGLTGEELIHTVREEWKLDFPILVISAKASLETKVNTLKKGADDYLTKPFETEEVLARVYAVLRRYKKEESKESSVPEQYIYKNLCLWPESRKAELNGHELLLTMHEYDILYYLIKEPEKVYSREMLYELIWKGGYYGEDNTVNVHVSNLRKKLTTADSNEEYIRTIWGIGFKMA
jgi:DNA-binding response OmpR family regulator